LNYNHFSFRILLKLVDALLRITHNGVAALRGRGFTKAWAGGALANSHKSLGGNTPPLSQNCSLGVRHF